MIWALVANNEIALTIRGGTAGRSLGTYRLSDLVGFKLRDLIDGAIADALARAATFTGGRASLKMQLVASNGVGA